MCGILGIVFHHGRRAQTEDLQAALHMIDHRGPDAWDIHCDGPVGFGHKRLAIIDLSPTGAQPMAIEDGDLLLTFNGEIYNFVELRAQLETLGHAFRGGSDSEVILRGYRQWGQDVVDHLRGMFALAIWDRRERRLLAARDRVGKKPFYYYAGDGFFAFASEIKALLALPGVPREADYTALADYTHFQYLGGESSAFRHIHRLRPASCLTLKGDGQITTRRYWDLNYREKQQIGEEEAVAQIRERVTEAVRLRLRADVEVGAFLSGGVDSSIVVGLAAGMQSDLRTFTISFDDQGFDEAPYAQQVADRFATRHQTLRVTPNAAEILPLLIWHYGEPFADPSAVPSMYVAMMASEELKVVLNGDGGDESFTGYDRYLNAGRVAPLTRIPSFLRHTGAAMARGLWGRQKSGGWQARLQKLHYDEAMWYRNWMTGTFYVDPDRLYGERMRGLLDHSPALTAFCPIFRNAPARDPRERAMYTDIQTYLPDDLLVKMDIACMAFALEGRSPFLDHTVMEAAASLPIDLKIKDGCVKYILKKAFEDLMPMSFYNRPKQGFVMPLGKWLRTDLAEMTREILLGRDCRQRGLFQQDYLREMVEDHIKGEADHGHFLWKLVQLELWFQTWIDAASLPERPAVPSLNTAQETSP